MRSRPLVSAALVALLALPVAACSEDAPDDTGAVGTSELAPENETGWGATVARACHNAIKAIAMRSPGLRARLFGKLVPAVCISALQGTPSTQPRKDPFLRSPERTLARAHAREQGGDASGRDTNGGPCATAPE